MKKNIHIENYIVVKVDLIHLLPVYGSPISHFLHACYTYTYDKTLRVDNLSFKFYILVPNDYQNIKIIQDYGYCAKISRLENAARYTFLFVFLFFC